jgi:hypothetical protein
MTAQNATLDFPFVEEIPKREKTRVAKLWDQFAELKAIVDEKGMLLPPVCVAELLNVSRARVHQLTTTGQLERVEFRGQVFVTEESLVAWAQTEHKSGRPLKHIETLGGALKTAARMGKAASQKKS